MNCALRALLGAAVVTSFAIQPALGQAAADPPGEQLGDGDPVDAVEQAVEPESGEPLPEIKAPQSLFEGWDGSAELGLNGSSGNNENLNFRGGFNAKRTVPDRYETSADFVYKYGTSEGDTTQSQGSLQLRNDWLLGEDSPWRLFVIGRVEYDQFQAWDWRVSLFGGAGYEFIETDRTLLLGRIGAGITREFGSDDTSIIPEGLLGLDFGHQINERQKVTATVDYFPSFQDLSEYRIIAKAAWELLVDPETNLSLKVGVENRYDSDPGDDVKRNDFDYFAVLVWSF